MPPVEPPFSKPDQLLNYQYGENKLNGQPLKVVIAAGPYTTDDSFEYLPLQALVDELVQDPPDLLMLVSRCRPRCGPELIDEDSSGRLSTRTTR